MAQLNWCFAFSMLLHGVLSVPKYPSELPRCAAGDLECLPGVINQYLGSSAQGNADVNIVPIDPLFVPSVDIIQSSNSPVNIKLYCNDVNFIGFSKLEINRAVGFEKDPNSSKFELYGHLPRLTIIGNYKITGSVLILPIVGNGLMNITLDNLDFSLIFKSKVEDKKNKEYLQVNRVLIDFNTTRVYMNFENLFNGDKLLGDTTNLFLNENWEDVINELKPALRDAIGAIAGNVIKSVFSKFPYSNYWLDDNASSPEA